jgi:phosphatidylglycerophosphatase A
MFFISDLYTSFFKLGHSPRAPGTCGSIGAVLLYFLIALFLPTSVSFQLTILSLAVIFFILGLPTTTVVIRSTQKDDPQEVVIDEVVGQFITLLPLTQVQATESPWLLFIGLALFRLFDITKVLGIKKVESLHGALGVMADDVLAGVYGAICFAAILYWGF